MDDNGRIQGNRVYCHQCHNQWDRAYSGLQCPRCESDFTEILETTPPPVPLPRPVPADIPQHLPPFNNLGPPLSHYPWPQDVPDPAEDDISTYEFRSRLPAGGFFTFSSTTTRGPRHNVIQEPHAAGAAHEFEGILANVIKQQPRNQPFAPPGLGGFPFGAGPIGGGMGPMHHPDRWAAQQPEFGSVQDILRIIMNSPQPNARSPQNLSSPFNQLLQLLNPANAQRGDAVFTNEAMDRVMTQLMEQTAGSTAPGPAADNAIRSLPTKTVDKEMMGSDGKAECSICMESVEIGDEVTSLPCKHWFHGPCITAWLKEHDTCPHCRKSISSPAEGQEQAQGAGQSQPRRRHPRRRSSSIPSPTQRAAAAQFAVPDSPGAIRDARQRYYGHIRSDDDYYPSQRPSSHTGRRRSSRSNTGSSHAGATGATGPTGAGGPGSPGANAGGSWGWFRDRNPFSG